MFWFLEASCKIMQNTCFLEISAKPLWKEQVQRLKYISETTLKLDLPLPPVTAVTSQVSTSSMWGSSTTALLIDLFLEQVFTPVTPHSLELQKENQVLLGFTDCFFVNCYYLTPNPLQIMSSHLEQYCIDMINGQFIMILLATRI